MTTPAQKRLIKDLERIQRENQDDIMASPVQGNLMLWTAYIEGPEETIWEGGIFTLKLHFSQNYPNRPPEVRFLNKMFHPNIYNDGRICLDMLNRQWSPVYDVWAILTAIKSLLADPNTQSPANIQASNIFKDNKTLFEVKVKQCVSQSLIERDYEKQIIEQAKSDLKKREEEERLQSFRKVREYEPEPHEGLFPKFSSTRFSDFARLRPNKLFSQYKSMIRDAPVLGSLDAYLKQLHKGETFKEDDNESIALSDSQSDQKKKQIEQSDDDDEFQEVQDAVQDNGQIEIVYLNSDSEHEEEEKEKEVIDADEYQDTVAIYDNTQEEKYYDVDEGEKHHQQVLNQQTDE